MSTTHTDLPPPRIVRVADAVVIGLVLVAGLTLMHPISADVFGITIRVQHSWRPVALAAIVALGRHWLVPDPSLVSRARSAWLPTREWWPALTSALPSALMTRALVLFIGYFAVITIGLAPDAPPDMGQLAGPQLPMRWDAGWYLGIVRHGYDWNGNIHYQQSLNFFPAFPLLVRFVSWILRMRSYPPEIFDVWTATAFSIAAFAAACVYLHRIAAARFGNEVASGAVLLLATYPFALFYSAAYAESLFLLCAVGAWYHLEREQVVPALAWGIVAGLSRPNGGLLTAALGVMVLRRTRQDWKLYGAAAGPILGTLLFSAWAYRLTGHPFVWAELQRSAFQRTYQGLDQTIWLPLTRIADIGPINFVRTSPWELVNLLPTLLGLAALWPVCSRIGLAAGVFVAINLLVPLVNGGLTSMGRYSSVLFPMFIWLALVVRGQFLPVLAAAFALCQGVLAALFFTWRPVF